VLPGDARRARAEPPDVGGQRLEQLHLVVEREERRVLALAEPVQEGPPRCLQRVQLRPVHAPAHVEDEDRVDRRLLLQDRVEGLDAPVVPDLEVRRAEAAEGRAAARDEDLDPDDVHLGTEDRRRLGRGRGEQRRPAAFMVERLRPDAHQEGLRELERTEVVEPPGVRRPVEPPGRAEGRADEHQRHGGPGRPLEAEGEGEPRRLTVGPGLEGAPIEAGGRLGAPAPLGDAAQEEASQVALAGIRAALVDLREQGLGLDGPPLVEQQLAEAHACLRARVQEGVAERFPTSRPARPSRVVAGRTPRRGWRSRAEIKCARVSVVSAGPPLPKGRAVKKPTARQSRPGPRTPVDPLADLAPGGAPVSHVEDRPLGGESPRPAAARRDHVRRPTEVPVEPASTKLGWRAANRRPRAEEAASAVRKSMSPGLAGTARRFLLA
jgi:hypothetical protein